GDNGGFPLPATECPRDEVPRNDDHDPKGRDPPGEGLAVQESKQGDGYDDDAQDGYPRPREPLAGHHPVGRVLRLKRRLGSVCDVRDADDEPSEQTGDREDGSSLKVEVGLQVVGGTDDRSQRGGEEQGAVWDT